MDKTKNNYKRMLSKAILNEYKRSPYLVIKRSRYKQMKNDIDELLKHECGSCMNPEGIFNIMDKYLLRGRC